MQERLWTVLLDTLSAHIAFCERVWRWAWMKREDARGDVRFEDQMQ